MHWREPSLSLLVLLGAGLGAAGCDPSPTSTPYCETLVSSISGAPSSSIYNPTGICDVATKDCWLQLGVRIRATGSSGDGEPERNGSLFKGFEIEVDAQGMDSEFKPSNSLKWWLPASGYLQPSGKWSNKVKVFPDWLTRDMAAAVKQGKSASGWPVVYVIVQAVVSRDGVDVKCTAVVVPFEVCNGCLAPTP